MSLPSTAPPPPELHSLLTVIQFEVHQHQAAIHRTQFTSYCDCQVTTCHNGEIRLDGDCACRDLLADVFVECHLYLVEHAGELRNPLGAARVHARKRAVHDWHRRRRTSAGALARTDQVRHGARARGLPDDFHRALLEYLADEAGSMAPLEGQDQLLSRLARRCADEFGGTPEDCLARVVDGIATVERHCRIGPRVNVGDAEQPEYISWWERYIERPLGRRLRRNVEPISTTSDDPTLWRDHDLLLTTASSDMTVIAVLKARFREDDPQTSLCDGLSDLVALDLLAQRTVDALLADPARLAQAAQILSELCRRTPSG